MRNKSRTHHVVASVQVLRWLFGGIVCNQNTEFLERQASLLGAPLGGADAGSRAVTIAELYDDLGCGSAPKPSNRPDPSPDASCQPSIHCVSSA
jgi:hypothetical protein